MQLYPLCSTPLFRYSGQYCTRFGGQLRGAKIARLKRRKALILCGFGSQTVPTLVDS